MKIAQSFSRLGTESAFEVLAKAKKLESEGQEIINHYYNAHSFN